MINVGVLGFAHGHVMNYGRNWKEHPELGVKITAGYDHDAERLAKSCAAFDATPYNSPEELLLSDIQAVVVSCETKYHTEMVEAARRITGKPIPADYVERRPGDPANLVASAKYAAQVLGWKAQYSDVDTLLETTYKAYNKWLGQRA